MSRGSWARTGKRPPSSLFPRCLPSLFAYSEQLSAAGARWHRVGDASETETLLALWGFGLLLLVAAFELDVAPERFLEDKLMVTAWLLKRAGHRDKLPFRLHARSSELLQFVRGSDDLRHLYEEHDYLMSTTGKVNRYQYDQIWSCLHIFGATAYVVLVTASVIVNEMEERRRVAGITGASFLLFCLLGYLTGGYLPVLPFFRCWIMVWNPFAREPLFMLKLKRAVDAYAAQPEQLLARGARRRSRRAAEDAAAAEDSAAADAEDRRVFKGSVFLWHARRHPRAYLRSVGHLLVISELVAMITPAIAIGIQWITALCPDTPPVLAMMDLLRSAWTCGQLADPQRCFAETLRPHCILKDK